MICRAQRRGRAHQLHPVHPAGGEPLDNNVSLGHELVHVAAPVWQRLAEYGASLPHAVRRAGERRIVVDKARVQVAIDGVKITLAGEFLDERLNGLFRVM